MCDKGKVKVELLSHIQLFATPWTVAYQVPPSIEEKEFRIMIVKIIQNLENKMESQINSLGARIEKMQEMFNKDLEEIKKKAINNE